MLACALQLLLRGYSALPFDITCTKPVFTCDLHRLSPVQNIVRSGRNFYLQVGMQFLKEAVCAVHRGHPAPHPLVCPVCAGAGVVGCRQ